MTRNELLELICPSDNISDCCIEDCLYRCDDCKITLGNMLDEYDKQIRADAIAKALTQFLFELGKNVAYEKEKVFGSDVIRIDALMSICQEVEQQLKEQNNE